MQKLLLAFFFCRIRYLSLLAQIPEAKLLKKDTINNCNIHIISKKKIAEDDVVHFFK